MQVYELEIENSTKSYDSQNYIFVTFTNPNISYFEIKLLLCQDFQDDIKKCISADYDGCEKIWKESKEL